MFAKTIAKFLKVTTVSVVVLGSSVSLAARAGGVHKETLGGGTLATPAVGPTPDYGIGGRNMVLVKNWRFGKNGTIKNYDDMNANFFYHDQFNTFCNGNGNFGSYIVSPDAANAIGAQPLEGKDCPPVREFTADSLKTYLMPLDGAKLVKPTLHNVGSGSFMAKFKLPNGGSLLGHDIVWETRVRCVTPPYFWFAIWTAGNKWMWSDGHAKGAEQDLVESFGMDGNYDGHIWHSNSVSWPGTDQIDFSDWGRAITNLGIKSYDASQYHTWTWYYKADNTYATYVDGVLVQKGSNYHWTYGGGPKDEPVDMDFLFDGAWGHTQVQEVNKPLPASGLAGKYYEWSYSRVYLSKE